MAQKTPTKKRLNGSEPMNKPFAKLLTLLLGGCLSTFVAAQPTLDQLSEAQKLALAQPFHQAASEAIEPFRVVGNVYYVGAKNIASWLIATEEGHFVLDTGTREMESVVQASIQKLGFELSDVKIILSSHAHFDHVQGHEALRRATGARVMAVGDDAKALSLGKDISPLGFEGWTPVEVDRVLIHEEELRLGDTVMKAIQVPGHTQGCTVWLTEVEDAGESLSLAFFGCSGPNRGVRLKGYPLFPNLVDDTFTGYQRLKAMNPDIYVNGHPESLFDSYLPAMRRGDRPHPLLQQTPWLEFVEQLETDFRARLNSEP